MGSDIQTFFKNRPMGKPATPEAICSLEEFFLASGIPMPADLRTFLEISNGWEGFLEENYVVLWSAEELPQANAECEATTYAPGLVLFGSDGANEVYAFDTRKPGSPVVRVPLAGMSLDDVEDEAPTLLELLRKLAR